MYQILDIVNYEYIGSWKQQGVVSIPFRPRHQFNPYKFDTSAEAFDFLLAWIKISFNERQIEEFEIVDMGNKGCIEF